MRCSLVVSCDADRLNVLMPTRTDPTFYTDANPDSDSDPGPDPTLKLVQVLSSYVHIRTSARPFIALLKEACV
jgi:hypothetical protein